MNRPSTKLHDRIELPPPEATGGMPLHDVQNVLLEATAMGLGGVPLGAFDDRRMSAALELPDELLPVYILAVGYPC